MTDWSLVVQQHGPLVWKTVWRLLANEADAADCFQNTFVAAVELARAAEVRHWPALLKRIATTRALERLRQRRVSDRREPLPLDLPARDGDPVRDAQANELRERLRAALAAIPDAQAQVFCLVCMEEMSYAQVAEHLALTVDHVGVLLHRAKSGLRERFQCHRPGPATAGGKREASS